MSDNPQQASCPLIVKFALLILLINVASAFAQQVVITDWNSVVWSNPLLYVKWGSNVLLLAVPLWFMFRGKNWARWMFLVVALPGLWIALPTTIEAFKTQSFSWAIYYVQHYLLDIVALIALFLPISNRWFRGQSKRALPNQAVEANRRPAPRLS